MPEVFDSTYDVRVAGRDQPLARQRGGGHSGPGVPARLLLRKLESTEIGELLEEIGLVAKKR
ncbi:hypothetical protein [Nocardia jinanensis]|uniref:Uncharacterized protein n=1 Tax=Nocardia jinanensis TaxID=382504 RepID=A0A917VR12_9NOCA|nr:hypothetical protein [Nocardia jinanensis]GGL05621.1 hypothetical protein GCM10011588_20110 [Nocardia jinanensis]